MIASRESMNESSGPQKSAEPRVQAIGTCPFCGSAKPVFMFQVKDRLHHVPGNYSYWRCTSCLTVFQDPQVIAADLSLCYPQNYYTHGAAADEWASPEAIAPTFQYHGPVDWATIRNQGVREKVRWSIIADTVNQPYSGLWGIVGKTLGVSRRLRERAFYGALTHDLLPTKPGREKALEIGCGSGHYLARLNKFWEAEGVEWDPQAAKTARKRTGCLVREGDFQQIDLPVGAYSLVFLHHVFEHLADPVGGLRRIHELLAPSGRAVLVYPNPQALGGRMYGDAWFPWEVPRHLVFPPLRALIHSAEELGLKALRWETRSDNAAEYFSRSRLYQQGLPVDELRAYAQGRDRVLSFLERLLIIGGMDAGEEVIVVLAKKA